MNIADIANSPFRNEVVSGMHRDDYHSACGLNPSAIVKGRTSLKHLRAVYERIIPEPTDAMIRGTVGHLLCLEPDTVSERVAVWTGGRRYGKEWNAFQEENTERVVIREQDWLDLLPCAEAVAQHKQARQIIGRGESEVAVFCEEGGVQLKGLLDRVTEDGFLVDLKFVSDVSSYACGASIARYGYDIRMACYQRWFQQVAQKRIEKVYLLFVESGPPYDVAPYAMREHELETGWELAQGVIADVRRACERDEWPGVSSPRWEQEVGMTVDRRRMLDTEAEDLEIVP